MTAQAESKTGTKSCLTAAVASSYLLPVDGFERKQAWNHIDPNMPGH